MGLEHMGLDRAVARFAPVCAPRLPACTAPGWRYCPYLPGVAAQRSRSSGVTKDPAFSQPHHCSHGWSYINRGQSVICANTGQHKTALAGLAAVRRTSPFQIAGRQQLQTEPGGRLTHSGEKTVHSSLGSYSCLQQCVVQDQWLITALR